MPPKFRAVIHGSLRKHLSHMSAAWRVFHEAGIEVLAPDITNIVADDNGFLFFKGEEWSDPRLIELLYLQNLKKLGRHGFSYFINPGGYIGKSVSYELGIAQALGVPCFFSDHPVDHPVFIDEANVLSPEQMIDHLKTNGDLAKCSAYTLSNLHRLQQNLFVPSAVVAVGGIIEYVSDTESCFDRPSRKKEREILLVRTHKWKHRWSVVGGKVKRGESLTDTLRREIREETGLDAGIGAHLCTFDQLRHSGYYNTAVSHIFVDNIAHVRSKRVTLNEEAQEYVWLPPHEALAALDIEPNAKTTLLHYIGQN